MFNKDGGEKAESEKKIMHMRIGCALRAQVNCKILNVKCHRNLHGGVIFLIQIHEYAYCNSDVWL